jgi:cytochrome P450
MRERERERERERDDLDVLMIVIRGNKGRMEDETISTMPGN